MTKIPIKVYEEVKSMVELCRIEIDNIVSMNEERPLALIETEWQDNNGVNTLYRVTTVNKEK